MKRAAILLLVLLPALFEPSDDEATIQQKQEQLPK